MFNWKDYSYYDKINNKPNDEHVDELDDSFVPISQSYRQNLNMLRLHYNRSTNFNF